MQSFQEVRVGETGRRSLVAKALFSRPGGTGTIPDPINPKTFNIGSVCHVTMYFCLRCVALFSS